MSIRPGKHPAALRAALEVAVAVINASGWVIALLLLLLPSFASSAVLPEERSDLMYHRYDGGGVTIDGPSLLVRKNFADKFSVSGNYYVDDISSASIDVVTIGASPDGYSEQRTEYSITGDYLYEKALISAGYTYSDESDYTADTYYVGVSQDFFGDLTNISFGYARGDDDVSRSTDNTFSESADRNNYTISLSQVITPNLILGASYNFISDEGFLNNPYRQYRYLDPANPGNQLTDFEVYPNTRSSDAASVRMMYYFDYRASFSAEFRYFTDDWGIDATTSKLAYTHTFGSSWIVDISYRYYDQDKADFYSDLFQSASMDPKDYRGRDKELSTFTSQTIGAGISYLLPYKNRYLERSTISLQWDRIFFDYDDFRDLRDTGATLGEESLYDFDADVVKLFITVWY